MSFGSDPQSFRQYALSLPNDISDNSSHESELFEPYTDSNSEIDSDALDMESNASNDDLDTSKAADWDEIIRQADPRYRHRFLRHMMDYYTNLDTDVGPYDYSDSEFNYSHDSLVLGPCFRGGNEMADVAHEWSEGFEIQSKQPKLRPELRGNDRSSVGTIEIRMDRMVRKSRRSEANLDPFIRTDPHYAEWFWKGFGRI
ncbi:hypothetical protein F5890DRAFT_1560467 [Lentinula detonsa]|uniref:Uncharacterized protein n=1 Tax=Lentinula detonsa TaxID=2804962 RepID=A0AA38PN94_9AGAR|nr:hypothetical protein F5890DRAFT_1560467 [Lentinula detonsa]